MSAAMRSSFVYVTYIRTTPEKLWKALTDPRFIRRYWFGQTIECGWTKGASWKLVGRDGSVHDTGTIVESRRPRRLVIRWRNEWRPDLKAEGPSRCAFEIEPVGRAVKLTVTHEMRRPRSGLIRAVARGWPAVLSNLKSLLETRRPAVSEPPGH